MDDFVVDGDEDGVVVVGFVGNIYKENDLGIGLFWVVWNGCYC